MGSIAILRPVLSIAISQLFARISVDAQPRQRSASASRKSPADHRDNPHPRNEVRFAGAGALMPMVSGPTLERRCAFDLIHAKFPFATA